MNTALTQGVGFYGTLTKPDAAATPGILVAAQERGGYDAGGIIDNERRRRRAKGRLGTPNRNVLRLGTPLFGLQDKSASAASELLNRPSRYAAVVLPCIHPIWLATRLTSGLVRVPETHRDG